MKIFAPRAAAPAAWTVLLTIVAALLLSVFWFTHISGELIEKDARQTLTMALNLERHGIISLNETPPYEPSMYREPLPIWLTAGSLVVIDSLMGPAELLDYVEGERARYVKLQNILWMGLLCAATYWAVLLLTASRRLGWLGVLLVNVPIPLVASGVGGLGVDTLYSDQAGAALLMLGSTLLLVAWRSGRMAHYAWAGLVFGLLALVKAAFLYVFAGVIATLLLLYVIPRWRPRNGNAVNVAVIVGVFAITVAPWMYRNLQQMGYFQLAERGGVVLLVRAYKDGMTWEEFRGAFYVWAPNALKGPMGKVLGFSPDDMQRGGRLQRLNRGPSDFVEADEQADLSGRPDLAISYYRTARAERVKLERELQIEAGSKADAEVDEIIKTRAMDIIKAHPIKHLAVTPAFIWRGAAVVFPVLILALALAARRRRPDLFVFILPAFGIVMFYALLTHFLSRYAVPTVPVAIVAGIVVGKALWDMRFAGRIT